MGQVLDVPYRSQWDDDARQSSADCGPACLAMVLGYYGVRARIDDLFAATGMPPGRYISFDQLMRVGRGYGVEFAYSANNALDDLKGWIDAGKPALALVQYRYWSRHRPPMTQDNIQGPHFVVVVGYDDQGQVFVNDPDYWMPRRQEGYRQVYTDALFSQAWFNLDPPNANGSAIVPVTGQGLESVPK